MPIGLSEVVQLIIALVTARDEEVKLRKSAEAERDELRIDIAALRLRQRNAEVSNMRESLEEAPCDRELSPARAYVLWAGVLTSEVIEFGPSGSFAVDGKLVLTCWPANVRRLLEGASGNMVRIVLEIVD